jgi:uncharacterized cupredoxin-like copper-binding protein
MYTLNPSLRYRWLILTAYGLQRKMVRFVEPLTVVLLTLLLALAACGGDEGNGGATSNAGVIEVKGAEYAFVMPEQVEGGVVSLEISNVGKELHEYALGRLEQGKTLADVKKVLAQGEGEPPSWFKDVAGVPLLSPGEEITITRELQPGTFVFLCFVPSPKGVPHYDLGMLKSFEVAGDSGRELPEADATITANKGGYDIPALDPGPQTVELRNADTKEREFFLVTLKPGKTLAYVDAWGEGGFKGPAPGTFLGAMQTIPPGTSVYLDIQLEEGVEYTLSDTSGERPIVATFTPR